MVKRDSGALVASGLLAGAVLNAGEFVLNGIFLNDAWAVTMRSLARPPIQAAAIVWLNVLGFALGIGMMSIYPLFLTRFSASKAAILAGFLGWCFAYLIGFGWSFALGVFPGTIFFSTLAWSFFELPISCLAAAWLDRRIRARN